MKQKFLDNLSEFSNLITSARYYNKSGKLVIEFNDDLCKLIKVEYNNVNDLDFDFDRELEKLKLDIRLCLK